MSVADVQLISDGQVLETEIKLQKDRLMIKQVFGFISTGPYALQVSDLTDLHGQEMQPYGIDFLRRVVR